MSEKRGDNRERREAIKDAHREGKSASEAGASTGASKQNRHLKGQAREELPPPEGKS